MNLVNERRARILLVELNKKGCFDLETRKQLVQTIPAYDSVEDMLINLAKTYNVSYLRLPNYAKSNYKLLKDLCIARPETLQEIFFLSFHKLAEVVKVLSLEELQTILKEGNIKNQFADCILSTKMIEINKANQKTETAIV